MYIYTYIHVDIYLYIYILPYSDVDWPGEMSGQRDSVGCYVNVTWRGARPFLISCVCEALEDK